MTRFLLGAPIVLIALLVIGCGNQKDGSSDNGVSEVRTSSQANKAVSQKEGPSGISEETPANVVKETSSPAVTPEVKKLGPKTTAASFEKVSGTTLIKDKLRQSHFGLPGGHLQADFAPTSIDFVLDSISRDEAYPVVTTMVHLPGAKDWVELETFTIKELVTKNYPLTDAKPGRYAFRVKYGATDPSKDTRPVFEIISVELVK
ncbi:hypothetical protein CVU37_00610 [candidate division BRC1 bacterium HGW-BRC1-1]|jgi:hypothetical protein|nr:MAG: hypothetical protein CVU37_00610 [candidate division BRC1 bacterium HGW-BRC1-1]